MKLIDARWFDSAGHQTAGGANTKPLGLEASLLRHVVVERCFLHAQEQAVAAATR